LEDKGMPNQTVEELRAAIEACNDNKKCIDDAKKDFTKDGGKEGKQEGGKVFSDTAGGKVFVTDGGKVF
jgi:hypothetical protein